MERERYPLPEITEKTPESKTTDKSLLDKVDKVINAFCKSFHVEGKENLQKAQEADKNTKFIIASSHISNLDAPAAIKALGDRLNIQITIESILHGFTPQEILFRIAGKDHFSSLEYHKLKGDKAGVFNPDDFTILADQMNRGKSPWIAIHPFTVKNEMQDARIGPAYLAQKTGAKIVPAALELDGGSINMEGPLELTKGMIKRANAVYHIGEIMDIPLIDVGIMERVLIKRSRQEKISEEERKEFGRVHKELKKQADQIASAIAKMLPDNQRGSYYSSEERILRSSGS